MDASYGYIISAILTGLFGIYIAIQNKQLHREVKTNHGRRSGQRLEDLGDDIEQIKRTMVTQFDLSEHAAHDEKIAKQLRDGTTRLQKYAEETRAILLAAINRISGGPHA